MCQWLQGWVSDPNAGSWTWAELSWLDDEGQEVPGLRRFEVFRNQIDVNHWQTHHMVVTDPDFLQAQPAAGAQLGLWVRSCFPGWVHYMRYASITAEYKPPIPWPGFEPLFRD
jgi:hypothetical protein